MSPRSGARTGTLAVDLVLGGRVSDTARDEGVEKARCRSEFAQAGARALEVVREGAAHPRNRRRERKDSKRCPKNAASTCEVRRVGREMYRHGSACWPSDWDGVSRRGMVSSQSLRSRSALSEGGLDL